MIKKLRSLNSRSAILFILAVSIIPVIQQSQTAQAGDNNCDEKPLAEELLCGGADTLRGAGNGYDDGKSAGIRGESSQCPQSDSFSGYCLAWAAGYMDGADARRDYEQEHGGNNNNNNNDNDNSGKRIIGQN